MESLWNWMQRGVAVTNEAVDRLTGEPQAQRQTIQWVGRLVEVRDLWCGGVPHSRPVLDGLRGAGALWDLRVAWEGIYTCFSTSPGEFVLDAERLYRSLNTHLPVVQAEALYQAVIRHSHYRHVEDVKGALASAWLEAGIERVSLNAIDISPQSETLGKRIANACFVFRDIGKGVTILKEWGAFTCLNLSRVAAVMGSCGLFGWIVKGGLGILIDGSDLAGTLVSGGDAFSRLWCNGRDREAWGTFFSALADLAAFCIPYCLTLSPLTIACCMLASDSIGIVKLLVQ